MPQLPLSPEFYTPEPLTEVTHPPSETEILLNNTAGLTPEEAARFEELVARIRTSESKDNGDEKKEDEGDGNGGNNTKEGGYQEPQYFYHL